MTRGAQRHKMRSIVVPISARSYGVARAGREGPAGAHRIEGLVELHKEPLVTSFRCRSGGSRQAGQSGSGRDRARDASIIFSGQEVTDIHLGARVHDVMVWSTPATRHSLNSVRGLLLTRPPAARFVWATADVRIGPSPNTISRENASRRMEVLANVVAGTSALSSKTSDRLEEIQFPLEYHAQLLGEAAERSSSPQPCFAGLAAVIGIFLLLQAPSVAGAWQPWPSWPCPRPWWAGCSGLPRRRHYLARRARRISRGLGHRGTEQHPPNSHFQHLEWVEGESFGPELILRGHGNASRRS